MNHYLYGIVSSQNGARIASSGGAGIGGPSRPLGIVVHGSIAAVVSRFTNADADTAHLVTQKPGDPAARRDHLRALRRDMRAHAAVLNALAESMTVLPARFGVVVPDERTLIQSILVPQHDAFRQHLVRLKGLVEVTLTLTYIEERVIREVVASRPELVRSASRPAGPSRTAYHSRIETGKQIAEGIRRRKQHDAQQILAAVKGVVREIVIADNESELVVLKASLLVERSGMAAFDKAMAQLQAKTANLMQMDCVGPLPPYSFVTIRI